MECKHEIAAKVYRGEMVEAIHYASIAVVNEQGELTHYLGDPDQTIMTRSSIKPFQIIPFIKTGAADKFAFQPKQIAICCGSHSGTDEQKAVVKFNLEAARNKPSDLKCGCQRPLFMAQKGKYPTDGEEKDPTRHNCSGKHSGFLALAKFLGEEASEYLDPNSETQKLVKQAVADYCEFDADKMLMGTDGCSAPNFSMPMQNLAKGFMKLANGVGVDSEEEKIIARIRGAIHSFAEMVSGEGRFDLDLSRAFTNNIVCKVGAESVEAIGLSEPKIGIVVKVHDGNTRALGAICVQVLKQLGILNYVKHFPTLMRHESPEIKNAAGLVTGKIVADFELRKV